jgi:8-oxo-dGTP pyrophosphatase MutT (NUDIX family)
VDGTPFVLFQRRSLTKDTFPGLLDVAVGGHLRAGETLAETAREAEEEIGLAIELAGLTRLGRRFVAGRTAGVYDREVQEIFGLSSDAPLEAYRLHPDEVSGLVAAHLDDALALFAGEMHDIVAVERPRVGAAQRVRLDGDAFVPFAGGYAVASLTRLKAVLIGESFEPFELRSER